MKLDATPQGRPLYAKLGFEPEYDIERWMLRRTCSGHTAAPDASCTTEASSVEVNRSTELHELLQLDHKIFGANRSSLLRSVDEADPQFTWAVRKGKLVAGYTFGRRGSHADQLGPWMAADLKVAEECSSNSSVVPKEILCLSTV